jgi:predicted transposase YbfD/YdcC
MDDGLDFAQVVVFIDHFKDLPDHRQRGKVMYPLNEILLLCLAAVLAGAETICDIARFGEKKLGFLRRFLPFAHGTPAHDHLGDILAALDADAFQRCFISWVAARIGVSASAIAIDGKTLRRSFQKSADQKSRAGEPVHIVSAFAACERLVLGHVKVSEKSNEITAIPELLDLIDIKGAVITIDAMGCQRDIAKKIVEGEANYILALKGNQGSLCSDIGLFVAEQRVAGFSDTKISVHQDDIDKHHGRIEQRRCTVIHDVAWVQGLHSWPGLRSIIILDSMRETAGKIQTETRLYISSLTLEAAKAAPLVRGHWSVETMHWVMDMVFRDDECRVRKDHAPANFTTIKHIATNLLARAKDKDSLRLKRKVAAWDDEFLAGLLNA